MRSIASLTLALLLMQGCFIHVGVNDEDGQGRGHWHDWTDDDDDDDSAFDSAGDTAVAPLDIDVTVAPGSVPAGQASILDVAIDGDADHVDLIDVSFGDGVEVLDIVWRDDGVILAIDVAAETTGSVSITLDFGDLGTVTIDGALAVDGDDASAGGGGGGAGDDGSGHDGEECP